MSAREFSAGRDLDALLYTDVMGAEYSRVLATNAVFAHIPNYSTDIAAAWLLVEKLCASGFRDIAVNYYDGVWGCTLWIDPEDDYEVWEKADTPALAICRSAIKALPFPSPTSPPPEGASASPQTPPHTEGE